MVVEAGQEEEEEEGQREKGREGEGGRGYGNNVCYEYAGIYRNITEAKGIKSKLAQLFITFMNCRFVGTWTKTSGHAKFWGFLMANYTDRLSIICGWSLAKKIINSLNKQIVSGRVNAVMFVLVYTFELVIILWRRPFRDRWVTWSHMLTAIGYIACQIMRAHLRMLTRNIEFSVDEHMTFL